MTPAEMTLVELLESCAVDDEEFAKFSIKLHGSETTPSVSRERATALRSFATRYREALATSDANVSAYDMGFDDALKAMNAPSPTPTATPAPDGRTHHADCQHADCIAGRAPTAIPGAAGSACYHCNDPACPDHSPPAPTCETCGGAGKLPILDFDEDSAPYASGESPCPTCRRSPEASK